MKFFTKSGDTEVEVPENPCQLLKLHHIIEGAVAFNSQEEFIPSTQRDRIFYCHQDEVCTRICTSQFDVIGSDDATTCIIMLIHCVSSKKIFLTHYSNQSSVARTSDNVLDFIEKGAAVDKGIDFEIYLSGGIDEDSCLDCLFEIIQMFKAIETPNPDHRLILKLCNVATLNSRPAQDSGMNSIPIVQGMAFRSDLSTCFPCHFLDHQRGPEIEVRMLSLFSGGTVSDDYGSYDDFDDEVGLNFGSDSDNGDDDDDDDEISNSIMDQLTIWGDKLQSARDDNEHVIVDNEPSTTNVDHASKESKESRLEISNLSEQKLPPSPLPAANKRKNGKDFQCTN